MNATWRLYLDDIRPTPPGYARATTYKDAVTQIKERGCPQHISFDNDLGEEMEGRHLAKWLVFGDMYGGIPIPDDFTFAVHSANPVAAESIRGLLNNYLRFRADSAQNDKKGIGNGQQ